MGQKEPNLWGLYDMLGNVSEWVQDWIGEYPGGLVTDPVGPGSGTRRVTRGGSSWGEFAYFCRAPRRYYRSPDDRDHYIRFWLLRME